MTTTTTIPKELKDFAKKYGFKLSTYKVSVDGVMKKSYDLEKGDKTNISIEPITEKTFKWKAYYMDKGISTSKRLSIKAATLTSIVSMLNKEAKYL